MLPISNPKTLAIASLQLAYRDWPLGSEPVLALHGLADHSGVWAGLAEHFPADIYHLVAPDLRGHGDSSKPQTGYSAPEIIADLEALMDHLSWPSAHVIAHSWAAKIALVWAAQRGDRLRSLVLVDPAFVGQLPGWIAPTLPLVYRMLSFLKLIGPFDNREAMEQVAQGLREYQGWSPFQQAIFATAIEQKSDGRWGSKFGVTARNGVFEDVLKSSGLTQSLNLPVLLIQPERGLNQTAWQLRPYRQYLETLTMQRVPGNHWPHVVAPQALAEAIQAFWALRSC